MTSYAAGPREPPLLEKTIGQALADAARENPSGDAVISRHQGLRVTYFELLETAHRVGRGLSAMGIEPGDRVGMWASSCAEWVYLQAATALTGSILVNINPAYRSHELQFVLRRSGVKALFLRERDARANYLEMAGEAAAGRDLPLRHIVVLGTRSWDQMLERAGAAPVTHFVQPGDVVNIQYTSGTTGSPKGVLLTHRNLVNNAYLVGRTLHIGPGDRLCAPVPLYHCFGSVMSSLLCMVFGIPLVLPAAQFDPLATLQAIEAERCTVIHGVPTMFIAELEHPEFANVDTRSLRTGIMAGAPCPVEIMRRVVREMSCREMTVAYGQTESSPAITISGTGDPEEMRVTTVGRPLPHTEVRLVSPWNNREVEIGEAGELCARGYMVMRGYDGDPEATERAVDREGWLHTGDLAVMRPDGCFHITGRLRELIIRGGENIYPREIEEFLHGHPKIADVYVTGLPDVRLGETVLAWIRLRAGESASEEEIREFCRGRIAHFKIPQYIRFVDAFPMTVTGKIQKFRIREMEMESRGWSGAATTRTA